MPADQLINDDLTAPLALSQTVVGDNRHALIFIVTDFLGEPIVDSRLFIKAEPLRQGCVLSLPANDVGKCTCGKIT